MMLKASDVSSTALITYMWYVYSWGAANKKYPSVIPVKTGIYRSGFRFSRYLTFNATPLVVQNTFLSLTRDREQSKRTILKPSKHVGTDYALDVQF